MSRYFTRERIAYTMELRTIGYSWEQLAVMYGIDAVRIERAVRMAVDHPELFPLAGTKSPSSRRDRRAA